MKYVIERNAAIQTAARVISFYNPAGNKPTWMNVGQHRKVRCGIATLHVSKNILVTFIQT